MSLSADPQAQTHGFEVNIAYNGVSKPFEHVEPQEQVNALFLRALERFEIRDGRPHAYALFRIEGDNLVEIPNNVTVHAAGIGPHAQLILREKVVSGG